MKQQDNRSETGFSLVELLVALAILAVALTPLLGIFLHGIRTAEKANKMTIAMTLARDLGEEIRAMPFYEPNIAFIKVHRDQYFPVYKSKAQPFGLEAGTDVMEGPAEKYDLAKSRQAQLDDVDDYDGWCRGQDCDCSGKPAGVCQDDTPLEANAAISSDGGFRYDGQNGRPIYRGFTRSVHVFNVSFANVTGTHSIDFNINTSLYKTVASKKTFLYYDLQDSKLERMTSVVIDNARKGAKGRSRIKVVDVTVSYKGPLAGVSYRDRGIVVMPLSQDN